MTAEVVVMNRTAVAVAADSTVTIGGGSKTYNTANKVFTLSKTRPVGAMVYGSADLSQVPWETVIKVFRADRRDADFPTLDEWADSFLKYVGASETLFPPDRRRDAFRSAARHYYRSLLADVSREAKDLLTADARLSPERADRRAATAVINRERRNLLQCPRFETADEAFVIATTEDYRDLLGKAVAEFFGSFDLPRPAAGLLPRLAVENLCRRFGRGESGVVVFGFGADDVFPGARAYQCSGVVSDRLVLSADPN